MLDRWVTATNKINSSAIVIFMFVLAAILEILGAVLRFPSEPSRTKLFDAGFALITGGLGLIKSTESKTVTTDNGTSQTTTQTTAPPSISTTGE